MARIIAIDIVSDVVCPWCYVGKKRLEAALDLLPDDIALQIRWHPYQLDPSIPPEGCDRKRYMADKFGSEARVNEIHRTITEAGRAVGIAFDFDAIEISPNTIDAHRLLHWARQLGGDAQHRLSGLLFAAYFEQGNDIGDAKLLATLAGEVGLNPAEIVAWLATDVDVASVETEIEAAREIGVTGVPCFILNRRHALVGAQEPEVLARAIRQVADEGSGSQGA